MTPPDNNNTNSGQNSNQGTPPEKPSDDNGTPPVKPDESTNSSDNSSTNNNEMNGMPNNGNASIGYSFVIYGSTSREKAQAYTNSSDIKTYLDTWYENNIKGTNYEKYITDNIFCNDRSTKNTQNDGYGPERIAYRWGSAPWFTRSSKNSNKNMMLTCPRQVDAFTVDDTTNGNGALTYKIGLITTDEIVMAGGWSLKTSKYNYYLFTGQHYWTMSPMGGSTLRIVYCTGAAGRPDEPMSRYQQEDSTGHVNGVRPVLNLSLEVLKNGDGTALNPFHA